VQKDKLLIVFPDGVGIRNYLYSNALENSGQDLVLLHHFDKETLDYLKSFKEIHDDIVIPDYTESTSEKFLRELICLSRLNHNIKITNNPTLLFNWNRNHKGFLKQLFYKAVEFAASFYKDYNSILKLESRYAKAIRKNPFFGEIKSILSEVQPAQIFCSHQRGLTAATIFSAAKDLGIPTTTVIYSWDNLPKARLALRADNYLVWSEHMKSEMALFYPEIPQNQVVITGTPQFEFYHDKENITDKDSFFKAFSLDPDKKTICFSGDDVITSPDDPKYLEDLAAAITNAGLQEEFQILFRRCPVDISGRYDAVIGRYKDLIREAAPLWFFHKHSSFSTIFPSFDDVKLLASTACYADIVINLGSTMAFDFAMYGKPCIFINYDSENKANPHWSVDAIYKFQHFRSMPDKKAVIWLNNKAEIIDKIRLGLASGINPEMKAWQQIVIGDDRNASKNIKKQLNLS